MYFQSVVFAEFGQTVAIAFAAGADFPLAMTAVDLCDAEGGDDSGFVRGEAVADMFASIFVTDTEDGFACFAQAAVGAGVINTGAKVQFADRGVQGGRADGNGVAIKPNAAVGGDWLVVVEDVTIITHFAICAKQEEADIGGCGGLRPVQADA